MNANQILVANIGNRNISLLKPENCNNELINSIKLANNGYSTFIDNNSFLDSTKVIVNNIAVFKPYLRLNILDTAIDHYLSSGVEIEKVILIASDQTNLVDKKGIVLRTNQDTIHEGEIVKTLLKDKYPFLSDDDKVDVLLLNGAVANAEELYEKYTGLLEVINKENPHSKFIICDAGGTAQQKVALKIMAEYLLPDNKFEVVYVNPPAEGKGAELELQGTRNLKRIIAKFQAIPLIEQRQFQAACSLLKLSGVKKGTKSLNLLTNLVRLKIDKSLDDLCNLVIKDENSSEIEKEIANWVLEPEFKNPFTLKGKRNSYRYLLILLLITNSHSKENNGDPITFLTSAFKLQESLLSFALDQAFTLNFLNGRYRDENDKLKNLLNGSDFKIKLPNINVEDGIITKLAAVVYKSCFNEDLNNIFKSFFGLTAIENGKNTDWINLRNKYSHEGVGFIWNDVDNIAPNLSQIIQDLMIIFGLKKNYILYLKEEIINNL